MNKIYNSKIKNLIFCFLILNSNYIFGQVPNANFNVCKKVIEQYDILKFTDLSTNSPFAWNWEIYDSVTYKNDIQNGPVADMNSGAIIADPLSNGNSEISQNPEFQFELPGCYTVKLTSRNMNGYSLPYVKICHITVIAPHTVYLGYGNYTGLKLNFGKIIDNGGLNLNYTNNQGLNTKSYFKILPTNGQNITIDFKKIKLADIGDSISIYDADTIVGNKRLGVIKNSDNGKTLSFVSTSPKMFIIFNSNASGVDSGFYAEFYTYNNPFLGINKTIKVINNVVSQPSVFVNNNIGFIYLKNYLREWYVNGVLQPLFNDKDTLKYTFNNTNTYNIKLKITPLCDSSIQTIISGNNTLKLSDLKMLNTAIFPNPTQGIINVNFNSPLNQLTTIELLNIEGKTIDIIQTKAQINQIYKPNLTKGIYIIKVKYGDEMIINKIIIN